jgi:hypothetical protein
LRGVERALPVHLINANVGRPAICDSDFIVSRVAGMLEMKKPGVTLPGWSREQNTINEEEHCKWTSNQHCWYSAKQM